MRAEIIIEHGRAKLVTPVYLRPDAPNRYVLDIPDDAVAESRDWYPQDLSPLPQGVEGRTPAANPGGLRERLNAILGDQARIRPGASIGDDYQSLIEAYEERLDGR